jgi:sialate O-acetylesterase
MIVTDGSTTLTFKRVAVGQVWLVAGSALLDASSPVDKPAQTDETTRGDVRFFQVPPVSAYQPAEAVSGAWQSAPSASSLHISAVATQFGAELSQRLGMPVGIIQATMAGAPAEAYLPIDTIVANDDLSPLIRWYDRNKPAKSSPDETINAFLPRLPAGAWNGMVAPLIPYAITGVVWDTSDVNSGRAAQYGILLPTLIKSWRKAWGIGDFPVLYLQSPASGGTSDSPADSILSEMRDSQNQALSLPNTAMEVTLDLYFDPKNRINDDQVLAQRLAKAAIAKTTADKSEFMGPSLKSVKVENGALRVRFDHVDGGLTLSGGELLRTFQIAGPDRTWQWADARIEGSDVIVSLHEVPNPVAARYAWADNWIQMPPPANLTNKAGFPAGTFRTDAWPLVTDGIVAGGGAYPVEKKAFSTR